MNHIRQDEAECYPTTIAMLSDQPVKQVIKTLLRGTGYKSWDEMMNESTVRRFDEVRRVIHQNAQSILPWISPEALSCPYMRESIKLSSSMLNGRGTITVRKPDAGHVVAFENGSIYDPGFHEPVMWQIWKMIHDMGGGNVVNLTADPTSRENADEKAESKIGRYPNPPTLF